MSNSRIESHPDESLTDSEAFGDFDYEEFSGLFSGGELDWLLSDFEESKTGLDSMINAPESLNTLFSDSDFEEEMKSSLFKDL